MKVSKDMIEKARKSFQKDKWFRSYLAENEIRRALEAALNDEGRVFMGDKNDGSN